MEEKILKIVSIIVNIIKVITIILLNFILFKVFINTKDVTTKIILIPFIICCISVLFSILASILNKDIIVKLMKKIYVIGFLMFWIGFLIFFTYSIMKQENDYSMILFTIPFWLFAIYIIHKEFIKKWGNLYERIHIQHNKWCL